MLQLLPVLLRCLVVLGSYLPIVDRVAPFCWGLHLLLLSAHSGQDLLIYEVLILVHCRPVRWPSPRFRLLRGGHDLAPGRWHVLTWCLQVLRRS